MDVKLMPGFPAPGPRAHTVGMYPELQFPSSVAPPATATMLLMRNPVGQEIVAVPVEGTVPVMHVGKENWVMGRARREVGGGVQHVAVKAYVFTKPLHQSRSSVTAMITVQLPLPAHHEVVSALRSYVSPAPAPAVQGEATQAPQLPVIPTPATPSTLCITCPEGHVKVTVES